MSKTGHDKNHNVGRFCAYFHKKCTCERRTTAIKTINVELQYYTNIDFCCGEYVLYVTPEKDVFTSQARWIRLFQVWHITRIHHNKKSIFVLLYAAFIFNILRDIGFGHVNVISVIWPNHNVFILLLVCNGHEICMTYHNACMLRFPSVPVIEYHFCWTVGGEYYFCWTVGGECHFLLDGWWWISQNMTRHVTAFQPITALGFVAVYNKRLYVQVGYRIATWKYNLVFTSTKVRIISI